MTSLGGGRAGKTAEYLLFFHFSLTGRSLEEVDAPIGHAIGSLGVLVGGDAAGARADEHGDINEARKHLGSLVAGLLVRAPGCPGPTFRTFCGNFGPLLHEISVSELEIWTSN